MAKIAFYGATDTVTGSRFLLEIDRQKLLIDCGMFQGRKENRERNWEPFPVPPAEINKVFLTHAHIDHTGYLPRFCRDGFKGQVHCTHPTADLCDIMLKDSAHLQEEDAEWANKKGFSRHDPALPLYRVKDAEHAMTFFHPLYYGEDLFISDDVKVKFKDAGHILGSAFVDIRKEYNHEGKKILFSGDFGRPDRPILRDPVQVYNVDYLILESTYGDRLHEESSGSENLAQVINESVERGGVLVIPSFAVGRTQALLYVIRELEEHKLIPVLPIYVDSPMAIDATEIFERRISEQDLTSRMLTLRGKHIFRPRQIHVCRSLEKSKAIFRKKKKAIIISASGMVTGGRILHHMKARLPHPKNTVLFIGYQADGTRGRTILDGKSTVKIHGEEIPIRAKVENISGFSAHGDYSEILAWLVGFNREPKRTFIVHGERGASAAMADRIRQQLGWDVVVPKLGETFELDV
jgi:metallo-beta-lactamase family protein